MKRKSYYWLVSVMLIGTFMFFGCSSSGSGDKTTAEGPTLTDYATGPMMSVQAVKADGSTTVLPATADTHIVKTDGKWIVWNGRTINLGYFDGANLEYLNTGLKGSVTPWAFGDHEDAPVAFDGTTVAFVARDVATGELKFYYMSPGGSAKSVAFPLEDQEYLYEYKVFVSGKWAVLADTVADDVYRIDLSAATPVFEEVTGFPIADRDPLDGFGIYWWFADANGDYVEFYDISGALPLTPVDLTGDGVNGTGISDTRQANGVFTWVEGGKIYYHEPGDADSAQIYASGVAQTNPVAGPDYFLWNEDNGNELYYFDMGGDSPGMVAYSALTYELELGDGFFAYLDQDDDGYDQIFVYDLADLTADVGVQVSDNGEGAEEEDEDLFQVDGTKVYNVFEYRDVHNPSRVAVMYDFATDTLEEIGKGAFQQAGVLKAAGGKAVLLHRDHSFRLLAKRADVAGKPVVLTPLNMMVQQDGQFTVENGIVAFKALDRSRYLNNPDLWEQVIDGDIEGHDLAEVYYIDLDAAGSIVRVTDNLIEEEENIQFDGRFITWSDDTDDDPRAWGYDIDSKGLTNMGSADGVKVAVDSGVAVWEDENDVYYYDLVAGKGGMIDTVGVDSCPNVEEGLIVWEDGDHPYYYDINAVSPVIVDVYETMPSYVDNIWGPVRTDGRYLVWEENRSDWDPGTGAISSTEVIVVHDTSNGNTTVVPAADYSMIENLCYPRISNGIVFFGANEYGAENADSDRELFLYNLNVTAPVLVRLTNDAEDKGLWDSRSEMSTGLMVWRTGGSSNWDWKGRSVAAAYVD